MAVIHRRQKWMYLFEPHTASRATQRVLISIGGMQCGAHHDGVTQMRTRLRQQHITEYDIAATVRNPIDALVTRYIKNNLEGLSFDVWVDRNKIKEPLSGLWRGANRYCWYENLQGDLNHMFHRNSSNDSDFVLEHLDNDKTPGKQPWWTYPSQATIDLLLGRFKSFMEMFGYEYFKEGGEPRMGIRAEAVKKWCKPMRFHKP